MYEELRHVDDEIYKVLCAEIERQQNTINLIASENLISTACFEAQYSVLTNKYAEGYPDARYYGGCEYADEVERLAIERAKQIFQADHANVQPHSGTQANMAVYFTVLDIGDRILALRLDCGGHLSHGHKANFCGKFYDVHTYGVNRDSELINIEEVRQIAHQVKPKLIIVGASSYPRKFDWNAFHQIAREVGAKLLADIAHIAGLIVAGLYENPTPYYDFVTTTTHKTLKGPRGGVVLCNRNYANSLDRMVFPGIQGGPLMHVIAAKATCFKLAQTPEFKDYQRQIVINAQTLAETLKACGLKLVSGGTDTHLLVVDLRNIGLTGAQAEQMLANVGIIVNKNTIPYDTLSPRIASGIRLGTPSVTARNMQEEQMQNLGELIADVLYQRLSEAAAREKVYALVSQFPIYNKEGRFLYATHSH